MRLARQDAGDTGHPRRLDAALRLIAQLCKELGRHGWQARPAGTASTAAVSTEAEVARTLGGQLDWQ